MKITVLELIDRNDKSKTVSFINADGNLRNK